MIHSMSRAPTPVPPATPATPYLSRVAALALAYFVLGQLGRALALPPGYASAVWPPSGLAFAALLLFGLRLWPGVWLGSLAVNLSAASAAGASLSDPLSWLATASVASGASLQALLGVLLARAAYRADPAMIEPATVLRVLGAAGPLACLVSALWGVASLRFAGLLSAGEFPYSLATWWVGDTLGVVLCAPMALVLLAAPRESWRPRAYSVALPLLLACAVVAALFFAASRQEMARITNEFERQSRAVSARFKAQIERYGDLLTSVGSFIAASEAVTAAEFRAFTAPLLARQSGLHGISWNSTVSAAQRARFERRTAEGGHPGYALRVRGADGRLVAAPQSARHVAVTHIEPLAEHRSALGFDIYSDPVRRAGVELAEARGRPSVTGRIHLVQSGNEPLGVLLLAPVAAGGAATEGGFAVGVLELETMLRPALQGEPFGHVELHLHDLAAPPAERWLAGFALDAQGAATALAERAAAGQRKGLTHRECFDAGGREWCLDFAAGPDYLPAQRNWEAWGVLAGGLLLAGLLGLFLLVMSGRSLQDGIRMLELARANGALREEVERRQRAERALSDEKERAEVTLHSIGDGVVTTDVEGRVDYLNPVAELMTGWRCEEARGHALAEVLPLVSEDTREPVANPVLTSRGVPCFDRARNSLLLARDGREYAVQESVSPIRSGSGELLGTVVVFADATESRRAAREARHLATHDPLTGLVNRREFERRLERALLAQRKHGSQHVLCFIDLDRFKAVNDSAGHRAGDELLRQVTRLLAQQVRERDTLARLGGDEFALLLDNCPLDKAVEIAEGLIEAVSGLRFGWEGREFGIGASIGVAPLRGQHEPEAVVAEADLACYAAKDLGRNRVQVSTA